MKERIRAERLKERNSMSADEVQKKSAQICERLKELNEYQMAETIMVYSSVGNEVQTEGLLQSEKRILLPCLKGNGLVAARLTETLEPNMFGVLEPTDKTPVKNIDLVIVPGVAFDEKRNRIGTGKGYYDRFLQSKSVKKIGLAFDEQFVNRIPAEPHDVPMDIVVTNTKVVR